MSELVLGTVQFGLNYGINNKSGRPDESQILKLLKLAWDNGIRELDTAQDYGNSEIVLGECLKKLKLDFKIHSKFSDSGISIQEAINSSLKRLGIPELQYFYFHKFSDYVAYRALKPDGEALVHCKGLAVSVYDEDEMRLALTDSFVKAIQLPLNLLDCSDDKLKLITEAKAQGQKIYIRSVFLQGLLMMSPEALPEKLESFGEALATLDTICVKNNLSRREIALGFIHSISGVDGVLIGVDTAVQLQENIHSFRTQLSPEVLIEIKKIKITDRRQLLPKNWN